MDDTGRRFDDEQSLDAAIARLVARAGSDAPDPLPLGEAQLVAAEPASRAGRWRAPAVAAAALAVVAVALVVASGGDGDQVSAPSASSVVPTDDERVPPDESTTTAPGTTAAGAAVAASRPIGADAASCVEEYSLDALANRAWAFDGTVQSIAPAAEGDLDTAVEFEVHEWFGIDGPPTVTVDLVAPQVPASVEPPDYAVGTRLLVSGEPRWGGDPLDAPVAWTCGFTRTWDEPTSDAWRAAYAARTAPAAEPATEPLTRPIVDPSRCTSRYARDGVTNGVTLFARRSSSPVPLQVIADPATGPTGPFALVQRYYSDEWLRPGRETVELGGTTYQLGVFDTGNGSLEWEVGDGTIGYVRARGLGRDDLLAVASALTPRSPAAPVAGFDVDATALPGSLELLHEQLNVDVSGEVHRSACVVPGTTLEYRISAIVGDPVFEYGGVIDRSPPLAVGTSAGTLVVIDGPDDPAAPGVSDVVDADQATWDELLTRSDAPEGSAPAFDVAIGEPVEVPLQAFDEQVEQSTLVLRVVEQEGVAFLQVETASAVLHPDAVLWKVDIEGRGGGLRTATVGGVQGYRLGDAPLTGEVNVEVAVIDGGDFTLQTTFPVRLVVG